MLYSDSTSKVCFYFYCSSYITFFYHCSYSPYGISNPIAPIVLLSITNVHPAVFPILLLIVFFEIHHAATQNPGHGTKFVTLPFSI